MAKRNSLFETEEASSVDGLRMRKVSSNVVRGVFMIQEDRSPKPSGEYGFTASNFILYLCRILNYEMIVILKTYSSYMV